VQKVVERVKSVTEFCAIHYWVQGGVGQNCIALLLLACEVAPCWFMVCLISVSHGMMYTSSFVTVESVEQSEESGIFAHIDTPSAGRAFAGEFVHLSGWSFIQREALIRISAHWQALELPVSVELGIPRPDVAKHFQAEQFANSGFRIHVFTYSISETSFSVTIRAHSAGGAIHSIARLRLCRCTHQHRKTFEPSNMGFFPIGIAAGGRNGTTLLMRYLNAHPEIVVHPEYPFERALINFGIERFHELTLPIAHRRVSGRGDHTFAMDHGKTAPQASPEEIDVDSVDGKWLLRLQVNAAGYVRHVVSDYYKEICDTQSKPAKAFAEKLSDFRHQYTEFLNIFPNGRLIILVRDPRDKFVSQRRFDKKRGFDGGWYLDSNGTLGGFLEILKQQLWISTQLLGTFPGRATLVRYEDLILDTEQTLRGLLQKLSLESTPAIVDKIIGDIKRENSQFSDHCTAVTPQESVLRWKTDLEEEIAAVFSFVLAEELKTFGYEVGSLPAQPSEDVLGEYVRYKT
jgi:hypothetical protein